MNSLFYFNQKENARSLAEVGRSVEDSQPL
jgi:hypothetical protein